jgi:hypothetical protein
MVESRIDRDEANQAWQFNHQRCKHLVKELRVFFYRLSQVSFELSAGSKLNLTERFDVQSVLSSTIGYPFERAIREPCRSLPPPTFVWTPGSAACPPCVSSKRRQSCATITGVCACAPMETYIKAAE